MLFKRFYRNWGFDTLFAVRVSCFFTYAMILYIFVWQLRENAMNFPDRLEPQLEGAMARFEETADKKALLANLSVLIA